MKNSHTPVLLAELATSADALALLAHNLAFHTEDKLRTLAECAKDAESAARAAIAKAKL